MKAARSKSAPKASTAPTALDWAPRLEQFLLAGFMALLVTGTLSPSDTPPGLGMFVVQATLWTALGVAAAAWFVLRKESIDLVDRLAIAYLAVHLAATWQIVGIGDLRSAVNAFFQTAAFVIALILGRHLLHSTDRLRSAVALIVSLAVALSIFGILQYAVLFPARHAEFRDHPEELLALAGITDKDSPEAARMLNRALSSEPLATFALTNSLASFLTPWTIVFAASISAAWGRKFDPRLIALSIFALLCLFLCLLLTKSRTSILAAALGVAMLAATGSRLGQRLSWIWYAGGIAVVALMIVVVVWAGGMDRQVLTEAPLSVVYRLQYWESTWTMIKDHPLLGVGPGNFKSLYPHYKLPAASEEIGDPHNFLLEIWATTGILAAGIFVGLLVLCFTRRGQPENVPATSKWNLNTESWLFGGALVGLLLAIPLVKLSDGSIDLFMNAFPYVWLLGFPVLLGGSYYLRPLMSELLMDRSSLGIPAGVLLVNLLAAGGIGFPNVSLSLALLLGCVCPYSAIENRGMKGSIERLAFFTVATLLLLGCLGACYWPVLRAQQYSSRAMLLAATGESPAEVIEALETAVRADPWSSDICLQLAQYETNRFEQSRSSSSLKAADIAIQEAIRRNLRFYLIRQTAGDLYLRAYRATGDRKWLDKATDQYAAAVERYPTFSLLPAKLAWAHYVADDTVQAAEKASEALRLDLLMPHEDRKLKQYRLSDPNAPDSDRKTPLDALMKRIQAESAPRDGLR